MQPMLEPHDALSTDASTPIQLFDLLEALRQPRVRGVSDSLLAVSMPDHLLGSEDRVVLGRRLRAIVRARDKVFSLGTAGYVVLLVGAGTAAAAKAATRLASALGTPVEVIARSHSETPEAALLRLGARITMSALHAPQLEARR